MQEIMLMMVIIEGTMKKKYKNNKKDDGDSSNTRAMQCARRVDETIMKFNINTDDDN